MKKYFTVSLAILVLSACTSSGVYVSENQAQSFTKGETTYDGVVSQLGSPTTKSVDSNGNIEISYNYSESSVRPETFIPYVGIFVGGADTRSNISKFEFDTQGVLKNYTTSSTAMGTKQNLSSGAKFDRVETKSRD